VKDVLDLLAAGVSEAEILEDFPYLEHDDIVACLKSAAEEVDHPGLIAQRRAFLMPNCLRPWQGCSVMLGSKMVGLNARSTASADGWSGR
jgi:hypothetical protein